MSKVLKEKSFSYDSYILSVPTWFDGELPNYWDGILQLWVN